MVDSVSPAMIRILRIEGLAVCVASILVYASQGFGWKLFLICILLPDITLLGYLINPRIGAWSYNTGHSYILPVLLLGTTYWLNDSMLVALGLIWLAHIGIDRALGYGLKSTQGFSYTHLGRIGKYK